MDKNGFTNYAYLRVTDLGFKKGQTPVTGEVINTVFEMAKTYM